MKEAYEKIDDCLSVRNGHLFIESCDTVELARKFGTPIFVISEAQLRQNIRAFKKTFSNYWTEGPVDILPAIKANWTLATRRILTQEGAGADVYSEGELRAALLCKVKKELISVNGGGKSDAFIERCIHSGVRITVEDIDEPELIDKVAKRIRKKAKIRFRVKPNFPGLWRLTDFAQEFAPIDLGIQAYKSGIPAQYLRELGKKVLKMKNIELTGFHFHGGRHHPSLWFWKGIVKEYAKLIVSLSKEWGGFRPKEIDIGGGFASPRDPHNKLGLRAEVILTWFTLPFMWWLKLLGSRVRYSLLSTFIRNFMVKTPSEKLAPSLEKYAKTTVETMRKYLTKGGMDLSGIRLQVEPGRALYGNTGIHLTSVKKVKNQTKPMKLNWILVDTTYFFLAGGVLENNFHDFRIANKILQKPKIVADIVGQSCFADRILPFVRVPDIEAGDLIAILDTGAYQEVSASNFNALPRPATVLVSGNKALIIKKAESISDIFLRDVIPQYLK